MLLTTALEGEERDMREYRERPKRDAITFSHVAPPILTHLAIAWRITQSIKVQLAAVLKGWENGSDEDDRPLRVPTSQSLLVLIDELETAKAVLERALEATEHMEFTELMHKNDEGDER